MKKIFVLFLMLILVSTALPVLADDDVSSGGFDADMTKNYNSIENAFNGQKKITDEEFQKTLDTVKKKQGRKKKENRPFKGKNFNEENNGGYLNETADKNLLLSIPTTLTNGDGTEIPIGLYKIVGTKVGKDVYLDFYQSATRVARVPAIETNYDFDKMAINFVEWSAYDEKRIKIIYGSMDFNAYTFIRIKKDIPVATDTSDSN